MERINNEYHQVVISKMLNNPKFKTMRNKDKAIKVIEHFKEYIPYINDHEFLLDILTLSANCLEHTKIQDREDS